MIASSDVLYDIHRKPSPWPGVVREPNGDRPATDAIPLPGRASTGVVARDAGSAPPGSGARTASPDAIPVPPRPEPVSAPSPSEAGKPDDDLARLGDRIAELAAGINAAEAQMMALIADFDRRGGWKDDFGSCAEWLAWRIGIKIGPARERVRAARALENLPQTAGALRAGSISYAKVRALTRVATPESEAKLLEFARAGSAANLEQMVRMWKKRNSRGTNPGRKSCKVIQGCTICVSCRCTGPCWTVPPKRANRNGLAGIPTLHWWPSLWAAIRPSDSSRIRNRRNGRGRRLGAGPQASGTCGTRPLRPRR